MKFKVEFKDDDTHARKGILKINNKMIDTPVLWLGQSIGCNPNPWKSFTINTILVNACDILNHPQVSQSIRKVGIHEYLDYNGIVMMDSGGFLFQKKDYLDISTSVILELYRESKPDIGVILDHPLNPLEPPHVNYRRWKKTIDNTMYMYQNNGTSILMPILHGYTLKKIRNACKEIKKIDDKPNLIGLGSLVPLIFRTSGMQNFDDSLHFVVDAVKLVRQEFPDSFLHIFGIGSITSMFLMFSLGVDSVDSMGWRLKAAYGWVQIPNVGVRYLRTHNRRKMGGSRVISDSEKKYLYNCNCPVCKDLSRIQQMKILESSFHKRALHNAWVFVQEEKMFKKSLKNGDTMNLLKNRLKNSPFAKGFKYFKETAGGV